MRQLVFVALLVGLVLPVLAAADVGQPTSFSVTLNRTSGTVGADLAVVTAGAATPVASDQVALRFFVFPNSGSMASDATTVTRGAPANTLFASTFSLAVPNEQAGFKYLAIAAPGTTQESYGTGITPTSFADILSFALSPQPSIDLLIAPTPPQGGPPVAWMWAKGRIEAGRAVPALSVVGMLGLGAVLALAGALLIRRS